METIPNQARYRALRLLVFPARRAELGEEGTIPAIRSASGIGVSQHLQRETQRRVVRAVIKVARGMLRGHGAEDCLIADLTGYRLTCDRSAIREYWAGISGRGSPTAQSITAITDRRRRASRAMGKVFDSLVPIMAADQYYVLIS